MYGARSAGMASASGFATAVSDVVWPVFALITIVFVVVALWQLVRPRFAVKP